jgi:hypothetical protein
MKDYRIMFLRDSHNFPVGCVAMVTRGNVVSYQVSTLNPNDCFDRKTARQLAIGRLVESPFALDISNSNIHYTTRMIMNHIANNLELPKRSRTAARRWSNVNSNKG